MLSQKQAEWIAGRLMQRINDDDVPPWSRPWAVVGAWASKNIETHKNSGAYSGINALNAWLWRYENDAFDCPWFTTFAGAKRLGGNVKKDETGIPIVKWVPKRYTKTEHDPDGNDIEVEYTRLVCKIFTVFNVAHQCEGIDWPKFDLPEFNPITAADRFMNAYDKGPKVVRGGDRSCYEHGTRDDKPFERIRLPLREQFDDPLAEIATWAHEQAHACAHPDRLNWPELFTAEYGSDDYAMGELIAEMTAAMVCGSIGLDVNLDRSAAYTQHFWREYLNADPGRLIFAATRAQQAFEYIAGLNDDDNSKGDD